VDVTRPAGFEFVAGHLALDFVNTVDWRWDPERRQDLLAGAGDLIAWAAKARVVSAAEARALTAAAERDPRRAGVALQRARRIRDVLGRVFEAAATGGRPTTADLRRLNAFTHAALRRRRLETRGGEYSWGWTAAEGRALEAVLWPVVLAAAELLTSPDRSKVRACAATDCGWLFLDTSRSHRRRWCTMRSCGNRAKARRFYARTSRDSDAPARKPRSAP
jgi:predicted RNA-binding Zn ribbon-like protein